MFLNTFLLTLRNSWGVTQTGEKTFSFLPQQTLSLTAILSMSFRDFENRGMSVYLQHLARMVLQRRMELQRRREKKWSWNFIYIFQVVSGHYSESPNLARFSNILALKPPSHNQSLCRHFKIYLNSIDQSCNTANNFFLGDFEGIRCLDHLQPWKQMKCMGHWNVFNSYFLWQRLLIASQ